MHGDQDKLVPIQQAEVFMARLKDLSVPHKLVVKPGQAHGWPNLLDDVAILAEWFEQHLARK
ncbi:MAG: alpha/beta hydrolase, partial [Armatimonadetes bacterium]|nr:alpha/beta hydrolase [Armatimonadota bacterium]